MKLLICTQAVDSNDPILGFFHAWLLEFAKRYEKVTIICLREGKHALPDNVVIVPLASRHRLARAWQVIGESFSRRAEYDAVFVHMNPEYVDAAGWLWRLLGKRVVLWYAHKSAPITLRAALPFVHAVATASAESFRIASSKVIVTGHGIDTMRETPPRRPSPDGTVRLMTTGRVAPIKGIDVIVGAFLELKRRGIATTLKVYGEPLSEGDRAYRQKLSGTLLGAEVRPNEVFVGSVPHAMLPERRADADYLLHASETGSLDKNVLDAAVSGVIPISSSEAYADFFSGFESLLIYPKGDVVALADRVVALQALSEAERERVRTTLKERVIQEHSLPALISRIEGLLSGV